MSQERAGYRRTIYVCTIHFVAFDQGEWSRAAWDAVVPQRYAVTLKEGTCDRCLQALYASLHALYAEVPQCHARA